MNYSTVVNKVVSIMRPTRIFAIAWLFVFTLSYASFPQSKDQNSPTPVTSNQIIGEIKARDIGDSRITTYYYVFDGKRGDIFINILTKNLNGEIDIFTLEGLRPRTKITLFADNTESETGRVVYMRKPERLILRVQGRTPNDDSASFQIKFAGSFEPMPAVAKKDDSDFLPEVSTSNKGSVKVNSVGTIIEEPRMPAADVIEKTDIKETLPNNSPTEVEPKDEKSLKSVNLSVKKEIDDSKEASEKNEVKPAISPIFDPTKKVDDILKDAKKNTDFRVVRTDSLEKKNKKAAEKTEVTNPEFTVEFKKKSKNISAIVRIERVYEEDELPKAKTEIVNPLANIFLKVELKSGERILRPMTEVLSMNVIKGVLTIVTSDGKIREISILDVIKMTIE